MSNDFLGGYRLVRKLGEGERAEVFLAHPGTDDTAVTAAAMKVYRSDTTDVSVLTEVEALSRAAGEHVVGLIDVASTADGAPSVVLQRLSATSLARLLGYRGGLRLGEAITILAPLGTALQRMHGAGVAHGALRPEAVLFDRGGAPVLACFGSAGIIPPGLSAAALDQQVEVGADLRAFAALAARVLGAVDDASTRLAAELDDLGKNTPNTAWLTALIDRLFELGPAEAVALDAAPAANSERLPNRVGVAALVGAADSAPSPGAESGFVGLSLASMTALVERLAPPNVHQLVGRVATALVTVRRRVWIIAGAVCAALAVALVVVPQSSPDARPAPSAEPAASTAPVAEGAAPSAVDGDDPIAALVELLAARERCIRDLSLLCLDAIDQDNSAALEDDRALLRALQDGAEIPPVIDATGAVLTERLGNTALIALGADSEPASILMMRSEAGWRIRDYLEQ